MYSTSKGRSITQGEKLSPLIWNSGVVEYKSRITLMTLFYIVGADMRISYVIESILD